MHFNRNFFHLLSECSIFATYSNHNRFIKTQKVMNDCLVKVNEENQNQAISRCQSILRDRREALASKAKSRN